MERWAAPGRVNLIGEHTDYNDGFVLPFALPRTTIVAAVPLDRPEWTVSSSWADGTPRFGEADLVPGAVTGWAAYVAGVVWALRDAGHRVVGAELTVDSSVPVGAGLASSAALECAILAALDSLSGLGLPARDHVRLAQRAENVYVGVPCGIMDQSAAVHCRAGHALFLDCRSLAAEQVPFDVAGHGLAVLVVDTRAGHALVTGEFAARRAGCAAAARELGVPALRDVTDLPAALARLADPTARRLVRHVVTENHRVLDAVALLRSGDVAGLGPLLSASHRSLRDDYAVTVPELDTAVAAAEDGGALGARMTGAGFGGCVLALVPAGRVGAVSDAVTGAFAASGFAAPEVFEATAGPGVRRVGPQ